VNARSSSQVRAPPSSWARTFCRRSLIIIMIAFLIALAASGGEAVLTSLESLRPLLASPLRLDHQFEFGERLPETARLLARQLHRARPLRLAADAQTEHAGQEGRQAHRPVLHAPPGLHRKLSCSVHMFNPCALHPRRGRRRLNPK